MRKQSSKQAKIKRFDRKIKLIAMERDDWCCRYTGQHCQDLTVHHILEEGSYPEYRFVLENLITLKWYGVHELLKYDLDFKHKMYTELNLYDTIENIKSGLYKPLTVDEINARSKNIIKPWE